MDANGTRYHLLLGRADWAACHDGQHTLADLWNASPPDDEQSSVAWNERHASVTLRALPFQFPAVTRQPNLDLSQRRGAARDRYGNWYWIDADEQTLRVASTGSDTISHFWRSGDGEACPEPDHGDFQPLAPPANDSPFQLRGLTVTTDHYLVVGVVAPKASILVFDLYAGGPPQQLLWSAELDFQPFDMSALPNGGLLILEREQQRYWVLNRYFHVCSAAQPSPSASVRDSFQPLDGAERQHVVPATPIIQASDAVQIVGDPISIEALPHGDVLILDYQPAQKLTFVQCYRNGQPLGNAVPTIVESINILGYDFAYAMDNDSGNPEQRLYVVDHAGNQTFAFELHLQNGQNDQLNLTPVMEYLPMRLFAGKGVVAADQVYYDFGEHWIPLVAQQRPRYVDEALISTPQGRAGERPPFDGKEPDCVWHRLMLDACIPPETSVSIATRAANSPEDLAQASWQAEPCLYVRGNGSELPFAPQSTGKGRGTWEVLLQKARGRYLQVRLQIEGNGRSSPQIQALRVYYPRFSYLNHYLPALYRDNQESASFVERFLANVEGMYTALEDKIAAVQLLFDVQSAPADTLSWLADWFGMTLDPAWNISKQRLFLHHIMQFLQYRGTVRGVQMALHVALMECVDETMFNDELDQPKRDQPIRIIELYRTRSSANVLIGDPTEQQPLNYVDATAPWQPQQGSAVLHARYDATIQHLKSPTFRLINTPSLLIWNLLMQIRYNTTDKIERIPTPFPIHEPSGADSATWQAFARNVLGFIPSIQVSHREIWQNFLARRYHAIAALNQAYSQTYADFAAIPVPLELPPDGAPLQDWWDFERVVLAMRRTAHRFRVLLPVVPHSNRLEQQQRLELAKRIINLEKPAHTVFDVRLYWAMFRVGEARLGSDSLIDRGNREIHHFVLGQDYIGEAWLGNRHAERDTERSLVVDRYALPTRPHGTKYMN